eukprot:scaffold39236_cov183-Amphora_coffeaeformis.AAC.3
MSRKRSRLALSAAAAENDNINTSSNNGMLQQSTPSTPSSSSCNSATTMSAPAIRTNKNKKNKGGQDNDDNNNDDDHDDFVLGSKLSSLPSLWNDHPTTKTAAASSAMKHPTTTTSGSSSSSRMSAPRNGFGSNSNSTLFGRVMQSASKPVANHGQLGSEEDDTTTTKQSSSHFFQTPTKAKRPAASSFLSPGGFKLRHAVEAASPFAFHRHNTGGGDDSNSALSYASTPPKPAWRKTTTNNLPWDGSLQEKLVFHSRAFAAVTDFRWMQRTVVVVTPTTNNDNNNQSKPTTTTTTTARLQQDWQQARTYWRYPHQDCRMAATTTTIVTSTSMDNNATTFPGASRFAHNEWMSTTNNASDSVLQQQQQQQTSTGTTMMEQASKFPSSGKTMNMTPSDRACQQLQMYHPAGGDNNNSILEKEWRTAFISLLQAWRGGAVPYFCGRGADHTILFYNNENNKKQPQILISSCNRQFREWCQSQSIALYYMSSGSSSTSNKNNKEWNEDDWKDAPSQQKSFLSQKHAPPPSPEAAAELAALRRAHVFGQTVGADVSVSFRAKGAVQNIAQQRRIWQQVPALLVRGSDDCAAVAEYYVNRRGQIAGLLERWPVWVASRPFCHATLQHATVRFVGGHQVHVQGLLLPDKVQAMVQTVVEYLQAMSDEEDTADGKLQITCTAAKTAGGVVVRPLDDVVIGQPHLWALMEDEEETMSPDAVTQI